MSTVGSIAAKVRSKNAGQFWVTVDIFCGSGSAFRSLVAALSTSDIAMVFGLPSQSVKRLDLEALSVIKISIPRPAIQGTAQDRDMHGASFANLVSEMPVGTR